MTLTETTTAHDVQHAHHDADAAAVGPILLSLAVFIAGWGTSIALWGIPGLYIPALALVPVMWVVLLIISRG
ncbi:hypothetical protein RA2_00788 [Roseovarius sp. A-2]|uniref:hypothetical protein n=1 Tax=Roseovarius sp. A-2 TaxID=1570360 RepID=UPI0009B5625F|nr:hypothetical protein [Roseovarius sp. A-2]GAW33745.1 hypothetical protein RA2_00788 [Roseovarius sp. A-2]